ncbi:MAG: hypothetical protein JOY71_20370 [Acetobacteraceae bacterium]|nr:hypothetical protein [Acetobacteraceae bacterium]
MGAAACGLRPIAELMFVDFLGVCSQVQASGWCSECIGGDRVCVSRR